MTRRERKAGGRAERSREQKIEEAAEAAVERHGNGTGGGKLDRRGFFKAAGAAAVGMGLLSACDSPSEIRRGISMPQPEVPAEAAVTSRVPGPYEQVPQTPSEPPDPTVLEFFSMREARTVDALAATILPGSPDDPGAREAGALNYIDHLLAHEHGFAEPIYRMPPFAEPYNGDSPPSAGESGPQPVWVPADQLPRYGYQSNLTPREIYRRALPMIDEYSRSQFGAAFSELDAGQQESVVGVMSDSPEEIFGEAGARSSGAGAGGAGSSGAGAGGAGNGGAADAGAGAGGAGDAGAGETGAGGGAGQRQPQQGQGGGGDDETGFHEPSLNRFFDVIRAHVIEGTFGDPLYGGNRDLVGWRMIEYPGAQRAYTPVEMRTEGNDKEPQSIAQLPHFNPGQPANEYVILPVSGSDNREPR